MPALRLHYYDLLLAAIAASVVVGVGVGTFTEVPLRYAVVGAALVGILLTGHGLFVRGPVDGVEDLAEEVEVDLDVGPRSD